MANLDQESNTLRMKIVTFLEKGIQDNYLEKQS